MHIRQKGSIEVHNAIMMGIKLTGVGETVGEDVGEAVGPSVGLLVGLYIVYKLLFESVSAIHCMLIQDE